ncbi:MAG: diguanylate cyclase [Spirochaetaceae bacterium]
MQRAALYIAYFLVLAAILVLTTLGQRMPRGAYSLEDGWEYQWADESFEGLDRSDPAWMPIGFPSNPPDRADRSHVWFRRELPAYSLPEPRIFVFSMDTAARFYLGGERIYTWNDWPDGAVPSFQGWPWHAVPIPAEPTAERLYVSVASDYRDIGLWGRVFLADRTTVHRAILCRDVPHFVVIIASLTLVLATAFGLGFAENRRLVLWSLGLPAVLICLSVSYTLTRQFILNDGLLWFLVSTNAYLAAVVLAYLLSSRLVRPLLQRILTMGGVALLLTGGLANAAYALGLVELFPLMAVTDGAVVLGLILAAAGIDGGRIKKGGHRFLVINLWLMGALALASILASYTVTPWFDSLVNVILFQLVVSIAYLEFHRVGHVATQTRILSTANAHLRAEKERYEHLATHDQLSGLMNRECFFTSLRLAMDRADSDGTEVTVGLFDIDHFKNVNDSMGHPAGDEVIRRTAEILRSNLRGAFVIGRFGQDEFAVVFPACGVDEAEDVATKIRKDFERADWPGSLAVTISAGIAEYEGDTLEHLLDRADKALYTAKSLGRNQVYVFPDQHTQHGLAWSG